MSTMGIISEEQRRIVQTKQALRRLATGEMLKRGELFEKKNGKYEGWINRVLNRMIELGIIEAHGGNFARQYRLAAQTDRRDLLEQAKDDALVAVLIWPHTSHPNVTEPEPKPEPKPEPVPEIEVVEAVMLLLRLMGGVVEKLDRIEKMQLECVEILREFQS